MPLLPSGCPNHPVPPDLLRVGEDWASLQKCPRYGFKLPSWPGGVDAPTRKCGAASSAGAYGVVGSGLDRSGPLERTTPSAPLLEASRHLVEFAATPPCPKEG